MPQSKETSLNTLTANTQKLIEAGWEIVPAGKNELGVYSPTEIEVITELPVIAGLGFSEEGFMMYFVTNDGVYREDETPLSEEQIDALLLKAQVYYNIALAE